MKERVNKAEQEQAPQKLVYLDQVRVALAELRDVALPNLAVERAIRDTLDNLGNANPNFEIIHKDAGRLVVEVSKHIGEQEAIFLDSQIFNEEAKKRGSLVLPVTRARLYPIDPTLGRGSIVGQENPLPEQRKQIAERYAGKDVVILDDILASSWTFYRMIPYFTDAGVKVCAVGVALSNQSSDMLAIAGSQFPIYAGYKIQSPVETPGFELKNYLVTPGSGATHFRGAIDDHRYIQEIKDSLRKYLRSGRDEHQLRRELFALQLDFDNGELTRKVSQIVDGDLSTEELVDILRAIRLPNFRPDIAGSTRSLYIGDYHSPAWQMTAEVWKEFSRRQMEVSIRLYEEIRHINSESVTVGRLGIFDEFVPDKKISVETYLKQKIMQMEKE